jgi:hypothetical protein
MIATTQIESMKEAIEETEGRIAAGDFSIAVGMGHGVRPLAPSLEGLLLMQRKRLTELEADEGL